MKHVAGAIGVVVVGVVAIIGISLFKQYSSTAELLNTSDASSIQHTITVAVDDWVGYVPLCSSYNTNRLRQQGIALRCINDNADYKDRMEKLRNLRVDMAVAEVGAYVLEGRNVNYPGSIVAVLDTSKGGDAIIANKEVYPTIDHLRNDPNAKYSLVLNSPSEFFTLATGTHFGITHMRATDNWKFGQPDPEAALRQLTSGNVDVAVLWEPNVTRAMENPKFVKLVSTADAENIIVDVLMVNRRFLSERPELVNRVLATYFQTLRYFNQNPDALLKEVKDKNPSLSNNQVKTLVNGVHFVNLTENCKMWFGCDDSDWQAQASIIDTIDMAVNTWIRHDVLHTNPLPEHDPYKLINSQFVKSLMERGIDGTEDISNITNPLEREFRQITPDQWSRLVTFGRIETQPITFMPGTNTLRFEGRQTIDDIVAHLRHYPSFRIKIAGHTGSRGDHNSNQELSQKRAEAVGRYLTRTYNVSPNRIWMVGYGGTRPLPVPFDQSEFSRSYQSSLARVEIELLMEQY